MKKIVSTLALITAFAISNMVSQNALIEELMVLDSSSSAFRIDRQAIVSDNSGNIHFFYTSPTDDIDYIIMRSSSNDGVSWSEPDTISYYNHPSLNTRFFAGAPSASIDPDNNVHVMYEYRGEPVYNSSFAEYPPSHMNYVHKSGDQWVTDVDLLNDYVIQVSQGNAETVCYLMDNQMVNYGFHQYYISYDYAWWGTHYNIVTSNNSSGVWEAAYPLYTYNLGAIDNRILNAPSLIVNDDSLYAIWYQSHECLVEMKAMGGGDWTETKTIYNDVYIPETPSNPYNVSVGTYSNESVSRVTMQRVPQEDFNELMILSKSPSQQWTVDTLMLSLPYAAVRPSVVGDTTMLFLVNSSGENYSYLMKYLPGQGAISKELLVTSNLEDRFSNMVLSDKKINPMAYMVYDEPSETYYLKIGRLSGALGYDDDIKADRFNLSQIYPNPSSDRTTISYNVESASHITLEIFNSVGELIQTLVDEKRATGKYKIDCNVRNLPAGIYFVSLRSDNEIDTKRMIVVD